MENPIIPLEQRKEIRSELNVEKWPLFTTSQFKGKSREITREIILENGDRALRKVTIGRLNKEEVGVLRIPEYKIFCILVKLWEEAGKPTVKSVNFALHKIASQLDIEWSGRTHKNIHQALARLRGIPLIWEDSFYQKETDTTDKLIDYINILEELEIFDRRHNKQTYFAFSSFKFNKRILSNLINNYTKPLYLSVIMELKKEISVLLYRHIDIIMADKNHYERNTANLFIDLGLSEYNRPSKREQLLKPVLKELEGIELSTGILFYVGLEKTVDGKDWKVVFKKSKSKTKIEHKPTEEKPHKEIETAIDFFSKRFPHHTNPLKPDTVNKLIQKHTFDKVMLHISRISNKESVINPVGLLMASLSENWDLLPTQEEALQEKNQKKDKLEQKKKELEQQERVKYLEQKQQEERLNKIFLSLPKEEQNQLKEEAKQTITHEHPNEPQSILNSFYLRETMLMIKIREILKQRIVKTEDLIRTIP